MEQVKKRYPYFANESRKMPDDFPFTELSGPCGLFLPIQIESCNGSFAKPFTEAELFVTGFPDPVTSEETNYCRMCVADAQIFMGITFDLVFRPNKESEGRRTKALQILDNYFAVKGHLDCLRKLNEDENVCKNTVQEVLAVHLFEPLAMEKSRIRVNASRYRNSCDVKCKYCFTKVPTANTSFGNRKVWHGCGDILVDHSVVTVEVENEEDDTKETLDSHLEHDSSFEDADEPAVKRLKTENVKDSYMPDGPNHIPSSGADIRGDNKTLSHVLSQTIVNAFLQVKMNPQLKKYFIPSFLASDKHVTIHMYRPCDDSLITQAEAMPIITNGKLDHQTILCVWLALNMLNFPREFPEQDEQSAFYPKSNFAALCGPEILEVYEKELQMPLENCTVSSPCFKNYRDSSYKYIRKQYKKMGESFKDSS